MIAATTRPVSAVIVGERHRKDFGDIAALARSIEENGLLQPIAITPSGVLIAGERRLRAWSATRYRDEEIPVHVVDLEEIVRGEWAENADRKPFTLSEAVEIESAIAALVATPRGRPRKEISETGANIPKGKTADKVAAFAGISGRTLEKARAVVKAAEAEPEKFGPLLADMDKSGRADGPYRRLKVIQQTAEIRKEPPPLPGRGPYRTIVVDVPWPAELDDERPADRGRGYFNYPTMSLAEIKALPVASIAHADGTMWFWTPNFHLVTGVATEIVRAWGYDPVTILTWAKNKMGRGQRLRGQTEHCIMAVRGKPVINLTNETTLLTAPAREDSRKPDEFYALVERLCPAPRYAELFARRELPENWDGHGDEIGKFGTRVEMVRLPGQSTPVPFVEKRAEMQAAEESDPPTTSKTLPLIQREEDLASVVSGAFSEIEELASECRGIVENAPAGLDGTERIQTFDSTAEILESLSPPAVAEALSALRCSYTTTKPRKRRGLSRAARCGDAIGMLQAVVDVLGDIGEEDPRHADALALTGDLEEAISEAEGAEFPGMFG